MRRTVLICAVLVVLSPIYAEGAERVWRMGVLTPVDDSIVRSVMLPYLATRGFVESRNLVVDVRMGTAEQMPELAQALVGDKPDVIIANSDWALHPARAATTIIPIVAAPMGADPVQAGVAQSWAHPGGNITGVSLIAPELETKRLSLVREALPSVHRIAVLSNHRKIVEAGFLPLREAAVQVGLELVEIWVESPNEYASAFAAMRGAGAEAVMIVPTPELYRDTEQLAALAVKKPTSDDWRLPRERGGRLADWLWPQPERAWPTGSGVCRAHPQRRASRRVTVPRSHAFRLRYQPEDRKSAWPHSPAVSSRGRRRGGRIRSANVCRWPMTSVSAVQRNVRS